MLEVTLLILLLQDMSDLRLDCVMVTGSSEKLAILAPEHRQIPI